MQTSLRGIARKAKQNRKYKFGNLYGLLSKDALYLAWKEINQKAAAGVDKETAKEFERNLDNNLDEILALAKELPRIWNAVTTTAKDRKRILRMLIEDVTIFAEAKQPDIRLGLRWRNQCHEEIHATKPIPNAMVRKHTQQAVELVRELSCTMTDKQIVEYFKATDRHTPEGRLFTVDSIKWIRYLNHIPAFSMRHNGLSVKQVAQRFNVGPDTVYYWIERGVVDAKKAAPGLPWDIQIDEQKDKELREWVQDSWHLARIRACL